MLKLIFWCGLFYFAYRYFKMKERLKEGEAKKTIHHHHYHGASGKDKRKDDDDFVDFEELK